MYFVFRVCTVLFCLGVSYEQPSVAPPPIEFPRNSTSKCVEKEATSIADLANTFIHKAKILQPTCTDNVSCKKEEKHTAYLNVISDLILEVQKSYPACGQRCPKQRPMDCSDILESGERRSGVYTIWPRSRLTSRTSLRVYCDMDTDGGGWTVIQRRGNFSNPKNYFYKDWASYRKGFGNLTEEFWLGNDNIYAISNQAKYEVRFDLKDFKGETAFAQYHTFYIDDEAAHYTLHVRGYSGNAGDSIWMNNLMRFSTKDRDLDTWREGSCAEYRQSAWWFKDCTRVNLNGLNQPGVPHDEGIDWYTWKKDTVSLAGSEIKLRSSEFYKWVING